LIVAGADNTIRKRIAPDRLAFFYACHFWHGSGFMPGVGEYNRGLPRISPPTFDGYQHPAPYILSCANP
jgi:hypothetical protein